MIHDLSTLLSLPNNELGEEVTVRCRIKSNRIPGEGGNALKSIYMVDDARNSIDESVALSFWSAEPLEEPLRSLVSKTEEYVLDAVGLPMEFDEGTGDPLRRGEEVLVRATPNRSGGSEADLYLNVTSVVIREPVQLISKGELRAQENCPRENYLRHVKNVYQGDRYNRPPYREKSLFRGDVVHRIAELAVQDHFDRFEDDNWDEDSIRSFCEEVFESEYGFRQALLVLAGTGLTVRDHVVENIENLFTDKEMVSRLVNADEVVAEQYLNDEYGYAGRVDLLIDGVPYDIKTTREPDQESIDRHSYQIRLYLFALLLESLEAGESITEKVNDGIEGKLVYPNTKSGEVRIESIKLSMDDVADFIRLRNEATSARDSFAPPSPYNRDCDGCSFAVDEWITGKDDALPPACTYHCQDERRWPCYEMDGSEVHSDCSRFDDCGQRLIYRDTSKVAYYNRTRSAFQAEQKARRTATQVLEQFDSTLLATAGYRIPDLECVGAEAAGSVLRFASSEPAVPAFAEGESVRVTSQDGSLSFRATYYGTGGGDYLFKLESRGASLPDVLSNGGPFEATYRFSTDTVERKLLPYLDFAQRKGISPGFAEAELSDEGALTLDTPSDIGDLLGYEELFVDIPVQRNRSETIASLVDTLVTSDYPQLNENERTVPDPASRSLVVGTTPHLVACAAQGQPDGNHYRLDGTGGGDSVIDGDDGYHRIQSRLMDARSIVTSSQLLMSKNGPDGISEFFHRLREGDYKEDDDPSKRSHSRNFFDLLVVLGGQRLTEPEYHFMSDLADRVVVIGDTRREGPTMISSEGIAADLGRSYFEQAFDHYRSFPTDESASIQVSGESPPGLRALFPEGPWKEIEGELEFVPVSGTEESELDVVELTTTVRAEHAAQRLVFDVTDTPVSPLEAQELFEKRHSLDATLLKEGSVALIDEMSMYLAEIGDIEGENTNSHEIVVRAEAVELPQFSRALLTNEAAEKRVVQVAQKQDIDVIITPYEGHASGIKRSLLEDGLDIPVKRPEALTGDIVENALISFGVANDANIVRPPLDDPEVLYNLLSSGQTLVLVGHEDTLSTKDMLDDLIGAADLYE